MIVFSPHVDDAGFSLGATMARASAAGEPVHIINVFTRYAAAGAGIDRVAEEHQAVQAIGSTANTTLLGLEDALLRAPRASQGIYRPSGLLAEDEDMLAHVLRALQPYAGAGLCFVPLAVGDHVDHLLVLQAALQLVPPRLACFYEDLPYAGAISEELVAEHALRAQALGAAPLQPQVVPFTPASARAKEAVVSAYRSQLDEPTLQGINAAGNRHRGERIWVRQAPPSR